MHPVTSGFMLGRHDFGSQHFQIRVKSAQRLLLILNSKIQELLRTSKGDGLVSGEVLASLYCESTKTTVYSLFVSLKQVFLFLRRLNLVEQIQLPPTFCSCIMQHTLDILVNLSPGHESLFLLPSIFLSSILCNIRLQSVSSFPLVLSRLFILFYLLTFSWPKS